MRSRFFLSSSLILDRGEVLPLRPGRAGIRVTCVTGRLWVTAAGQHADAVLEPGDSREYGAREKVVVEALRLAVAKVERVRVGSPGRQAVRSPWAIAASQPRIAFFR